MAVRGETNRYRYSIYKLPPNFLQGTLILLWKEKQLVATLDRLRPICIQTLPTKILKKNILRKLQS